jgi:hypothetical protein
LIVDTPLPGPGWKIFIKVKQLIYLIEGPNNPLRISQRANNANNTCAHNKIPFFYSRTLFVQLLQVWAQLSLKLRDASNTYDPKFISEIIIIIIIIMKTLILIKLVKMIIIIIVMMIIIM